MKNKGIVLLELYWTRAKDPRVPLGLASLAASLHATPGIEVRTLPVAVNVGILDVESVAEQVLSLVEDGFAIGVGVYVWAESLVQRLLPILRRRGFAGQIILGGPQISYSGAGIEKLYPDANVFVRGHGEHVLPRLVLDPKVRLAGVHHRGQPDLSRPAEVELNTLPSPWLAGLIPLHKGGFVRWETQRGCPFRCSFCQHRDVGSRYRRRLVSEDRVRDEAELFCRAGVADIAVLDPIFNIRDHGQTVLEHFIRRQYEGHLSLQCRLELADDAFLDAASRLNTTLEFGLQTTSEVESRTIDRRNRMDKAGAALNRALFRSQGPFGILDSCNPTSFYPEKRKDPGSGSPGRVAGCLRYPGLPLRPCPGTLLLPTLSLGPVGRVPAEKLYPRSSLTHLRKASHASASEANSLSPCSSPRSA